MFHAGTKKEGNKIYAIGGRVLNFISIAKNFDSLFVIIFNLSDHKHFNFSDVI